MSWRPLAWREGAACWELQGCSELSSAPGTPQGLCNSAGDGEGGTDLKNDYTSRPFMSTKHHFFCVCSVDKSSRMKQPLRFYCIVMIKAQERKRYAPSPCFLRCLCTSCGKLSPHPSIGDWRRQPVSRGCKRACICGEMGRLGTKSKIHWN